MTLSAYGFCHGDLAAVTRRRSPAPPGPCGGCPGTPATSARAACDAGVCTSRPLTRPRRCPAWQVRCGCGERPRLRSLATSSGSGPRHPEPAEDGPDVERDLRVQKRRNPSRCQRITASQARRWPEPPSSPSRHARGLPRSRGPTAQAYTSVTAGPGEHADLLPQRRILEHELAPRLEERPHRAKERPHQFPQVVSLRLCESEVRGG